MPGVVEILTAAAPQLVQPTFEVGKGIFASLKSRYDYIKSMHENFETLVNEADFLFSREEDVKNKISENQILMKMTHECSIWLNHVERMRENYEGLTSVYKQKFYKSCGGCHLRSRLKLSKKIVQLKEAIIELKGKSQLGHRFLVNRPQERVEPKFSREMKFPSMCYQVGKLVDLVKNDNVKKIGIWGIPGVGKTTILKSLNDEMDKLNIFDIVLWVTMPKDALSRHLYKVQEIILKRLNTNMETINNEDIAATLISKILNNMKYLLLIDEVYEEFDLKRIGYQDSHLQGKVVLATRERITSHLMKMDENVKVEQLSIDDARQLFHCTVGEVVDHPHIQPFAERILKQCGNLPQVVKAVGAQLKDELDERIWCSTLTMLQSPNRFEMKHMEDLFNTFKLIYEGLHCSLKDCLLYTSSFPQDHEIYHSYLIECWKSEQIIGIGERRLTKTLDEGHAKTKILINKCLLDLCRNKDYVKMPIIFRVAALRMAHQHNFGLLLTLDKEFESYPPLESWRNARVISLLKANLTQLPESPECPRACTLFLQKNANLSKLPESFFDGMSTLKLLDLHDTGIQKLPPSISKLINLRSLYLNGCHKLKDLPSEVGELHNIEVLDICNSGICGLPIVIGKLIRLQCLRLSISCNVECQHDSEARNLGMASSGVFDKLLELEEVAINFDSSDPRWNEIAPIISTQLAKLAKISTFKYYFPNTESLECFIQTSLSWMKGEDQSTDHFKSFYIKVGSHMMTQSMKFDISNCASRRHLLYSDGKDIPIVIKQILRRASTFELIGHQNIINLSDFGIDSMKSLSICIINECKEIETVIHHDITSLVFPWLMELHLSKLQKLKCLCVGSISEGSFARLTTLTIYECAKMTKLFSFEMVKYMIKLKQLRVEKCSLLTEIFELEAQPNPNDAETHDITILPKLENLELVNLEELVTIQCDESFEWRTLQNLEIIQCNRMTNIFFTKSNATKLRSIRCSKAWWETLHFKDETRAQLLDLCSFLD